ncbi:MULTISPECIES: hypothetical protein [Comamonas]|uniref:hypothetical protein n=1 Tax=Comamonas TaxID=283 RepID=UPI000632BE14|nr:MULTISPECIES: hypothetical protein [Comamonas]GAO70291.1 putative two-component histidine kinase [Comamonas sp. E6]
MSRRTAEKTYHYVIRMALPGALISYQLLHAAQHRLRRPIHGWQQKVCVDIQGAYAAHLKRHKFAQIFQICIQQADRMQLQQERHDFFAQTQDGAMLTVLGTANALPIGKAG